MKPTLLITLLACLASPSALAGEAPQTQIRKLIATTYDRPDAKVMTGPIEVGTTHAVADWTQGDRGGRALLRRHGEHWEIVLCGGAGLRTEAGLKQAGVPHKEAGQLAQGITSAEKTVPNERRRQFDLFGTAQDPRMHHDHGAETKRH